MRVLADFVLESDLCLPDGAPPLVVQSLAAGFEATLTNIAGQQSVHGAELACRLVFEVPQFMDAQRVADDTIVILINALACTTNRRFAVQQLLKLVQWDPGQIERQAAIFHRSPLDHRAEPSLVPEFARTAERLIAMHSETPQQVTAMRWYRLGIQSEEPEEQFTYFWFALELAAQMLKQPAKVPSKCPHCQEPLYCQKCRKHPVHRPFPAQAISQLIERVHPENANEIFDTLGKIRHTLVHGDRLRSIESELPCTTEEAINTLAFITWNSIGLMHSRPDPLPNEQLPSATLRLSCAIPWSHASKLSLRYWATTIDLQSRIFQTSR
jgi:hypothetical protein